VRVTRVRESIAAQIAVHRGSSPRWSVGRVRTRCEESGLP
jgi:hypothetical protein